VTEEEVAVYPAQYETEVLLKDGMRLMLKPYGGRILSNGSPLFPGSVIRLSTCGFIMYRHWGGKTLSVSVRWIIMTPLPLLLRR